MPSETRESTNKRTDAAATPIVMSARGPATMAWQMYALLALVALFHVLTLRAGHAWADDFALYVLHARNLVEGRAYADTGYIYNPSDPWHSPRVYPPGFPLLLAPVYAIFGLNLFALRMVVIASLVGAVAAFVALVRPVLSPRLVLVTAAMMGFQPYFIRFKNLLLPDFSFVLVVLLSLYCLRRLHESRAPTRADLVWALLAGTCMAISLSLRTVGVALFGGLALYHLLRRTLPSRAILISVATAALLYAIQYVSMPTSSGYVAQVADAAPPVLRQTALLLRLQRLVELFTFTDIMWQGTALAITRAMMFVAAGLATVGYVVSLRRLSVVETFAIAYVAVLVIFPFSAARYLLPIIPLILLYVVTGLLFLHERGGVMVRAGVIAVAALVGVIYGANVLGVERGPFRTGVTGVAATAAFEYVRQCTQPNAIIASRRPRTVALFTGRSAISAGRRQLDDADAYAAFVRTAAVDYVATFRNSGMHAATAAMPGTFSRVFQNDQWVIYRNESRLSGQQQPPPAGCVAL